MKHFKYVPLSYHWVEVFCRKLGMHYLPSRIDWDSGSIGHECGVIVSLGVGGVAFVLVWGCLCREHLCWTCSGTLGGLWAWWCCFCWVPLVFWVGSILFCRTKKKGKLCKFNYKFVNEVIEMCNEYDPQQIFRAPSLLISFIRVEDHAFEDSVC